MSPCGDQGISSKTALSIVGKSRNEFKMELKQRGLKLKKKPRKLLLLNDALLASEADSLHTTHYSGCLLTFYFSMTIV